MGGLFLDMQSVREYLAVSSSGFRVLNLFCFTGSLGVAALAGGAREVVQVDVSKMALTWAKENFELNSQLGTGRMVYSRGFNAFFRERAKEN